MPSQYFRFPPCSPKGSRIAGGDAAEEAVGLESDATPFLAARSWLRSCSSNPLTRDLSLSISLWEKSAQAVRCGEETRQTWWRGEACELHSSPYCYTGRLCYGNYGMAGYYRIWCGLLGTSHMLWRLGCVSGVTESSRTVKRCQADPGGEKAAGRR